MLYYDFRGWNVPGHRPANAWLRAALLVFASLLAAGGCTRRASKASYRCHDCNVLLISIDALRADHLSSYGYARETSPHLDALAAEGVLFEDFVHSGGGTLASHMSMLTSLYPLSHGLGWKSDRVLEPGRVTLAERLHEAGFATAAFTDGGWMLRRFGFSQGFDVYDDSGGHFEVILPKAYTWLAENRGRRFFLFLHTYDVHSGERRLPYECPADYSRLYTSAYQGSFDGCRDGVCASRLLLAIDARLLRGEISPERALAPADLDYLVGLYDGCVRYVDDRLGELFRRMRALGLYDKTLIVVTSDHGEEFLEHGLLLHAQDGYEEIVRVPLVVRFPGGRFAGRRVQQLATTVDLMPTVLDVLGLPVTEQAQGISLMPSITRDEAVREDVHILSALRTGRFTYLPDRRELYDRSTDPGEQVNLWDRPEHRERRADFQRRVRELVERDRTLGERFRRGSKRASAAVSGQEEERLRALGYLR